MGFFSSKSNSDSCHSCDDQTSLSKYASMPLKDSRVVSMDDIDMERRTGQTFYTVQGETIKADMAFKMGPWYFYWMADINMENPQYSYFCSRKCAIQYSKSENIIFLLHPDSGGNIGVDEPIKPHQKEIDQYRYDNNIEGHKWNASD
ncbi:hypothetical protein OAP50_01245 [bacterium]|nr:hypothetical protein [bacterium]